MSQKKFSGTRMMKQPSQAALNKAVYSLKGYFMPTPYESLNRNFRPAFERAQAEWIKTLRAYIAEVENVTFAQFCFAQKIGLRAFERYEEQAHIRGPWYVEDETGAVVAEGLTESEARARAGEESENDRKIMG